MNTDTKKRPLIRRYALHYAPPMAPIYARSTNKDHALALAQDLERDARAFLGYQGTRIEPLFGPAWPRDPAPAGYRVLLVFGTVPDDGDLASTTRTPRGWATDYARAGRYVTDPDDLHPIGGYLDGIENWRENGRILVGLAFSVITLDPDAAPLEIATDQHRAALNLYKGGGKIWPTTGEDLWTVVDRLNGQIAALRRLETCEECDGTGWIARGHICNCFQ